MTRQPIQDSTLGIQHGGKHYKDMKIQPIDYAEENKLTATEFSVIKYVTRHRVKNGIEDLKKAFHFLQMLAFRFYGVKVEITYQEPIPPKIIDTPDGEKVVMHGVRIEPNPGITAEEAANSVKDFSQSLHDLTRR